MRVDTSDCAPEPCIGEGVHPNLDVLADPRVGHIGLIQAHLREHPVQVPERDDVRALGYCGAPGGDDRSLLDVFLQDYAGSGRLDRRVLQHGPSVVAGCLDAGHLGLSARHVGLPESVLHSVGAGPIEGRLRLRGTCLVDGQFGREVLVQRIPRLLGCGQLRPGQVPAVDGGIDLALRHEALGLQALHANELLLCNLQVGLCFVEGRTSLHSGLRVNGIREAL